MNLKTSHADNEEPLPPFGLIDNDRKSVPPPDGNTGHSEHSSGHGLSLHAIHGALASFAFLIMMPAAIFMMRTKQKHCFRAHWMMQVISVIAGIGGIALGVYSTQLVVQVN